MGLFIYSFLESHKEQFGGDITLSEKVEESTLTDRGSELTSKYFGKNIWLPIRFTDLDVNEFPATEYNAAGELLIPFAAISIGMQKNYIKTPLSQRKGSVHELYNINDYPINIKGFLIDLENRKFPESQLVQLETLWRTETAIGLENALTNIFLDEDEEFRKVVIKRINFPENKGGAKHLIPFTMTLESDIVFTLEDEPNDI